MTATQWVHVNSTYEINGTVQPCGAVIEVPYWGVRMYAIDRLIFLGILSLAEEMAS